MKTIKYLFSAFVVIVAVACQAVSIDVTPIDEESGSKLTTITCAFPSMTDQNGTKVSLASDGTTGWQAGDKIVIYGKRNHADSDDNPLADKVIHTLTAAEVADPSNAVFTVDLSGLTADPAGNHPFNAVYPADESDDYLPFYSPWGASGRARFIDTNKLLLAGWVDGGVMTLKNVCAAITFTVDGDFDKYYFSGYNGTEIVGYGQYLVEFNNTDDQTEAERYHRKDGEDWGCKNPLTVISGPVVGDGTTLNYVYIPNVVNLPSGFTIVLEKSGKKLKKISSKAALSLTHDQMINLGTLPPSKMKDYELIPASEKASAIDLSNIAPYKSANCYVVSAAGTTNDNKVFKFPTVKGNSYVKDSSAGTSVGSVVSAELLWETWNNSSTVTAKSIINAVEYNDGFVYFRTANPLHEGNAVIAVKDAEGTILWSWHIWVPLTDYTYDKYGISEVNMMSRNLGALIDAGDGSVTSHGLHYQWGRKDPFVEQGAHESSSFAKVAGVAKTNRTSLFANEAELNAHPTEFVYYDKGYQWYTNKDITSFWGSTKTIYDPCPPGWKVPDKATKTTQLFDGDIPTWSYDSRKDSHYLVTIGTAVFPISSFIYYNGNMDGREQKFLLWSSSSRINSSGYTVGYWLQVYGDKEATSGTYSKSSEKVAYGANVRCVAE